MPRTLLLTMPRTLLLIMPRIQLRIMPRTLQHIMHRLIILQHIIPLTITGPEQRPITIIITKQSDHRPIQVLVRILLVLRHFLQMARILIKQLTITVHILQAILLHIIHLVARTQPLITPGIRRPIMPRILLHITPRIRPLIMPRILLHTIL